ncbi:thiolase-like protein [Dunaliella salina]|uniref:beta-ketoacyl-[acyl-carrier-protein] synthase I n=1 Tax=Dunaliella salina TaxID=3046 RepID=A0ABQ7GZV0_DUNSA|nr:thiolase-like protein [Dunaliella salina]|eukprot:KAF5840134.1 thiolase-like protein [Dunaliella salina]
MGGLTVFQDGVANLVQKGYKKISPFFIPYAITNMGGALLAIDQGFMGPNYSISTACATANYAFVAAANHIRAGVWESVLLRHFLVSRSTLVGDIAEVKALKSVFKDTKHIKMNGTKSLIGHCLGAAGGMEAIATIKAIETGYLHPTLNQDNLVDEVSDWDTCAGGKVQHEVTAGISNSFGFGGHNSVCVFAPFKE